MQKVQRRGNSSLGKFAEPRSHVWELGVREGMHVADFGVGSGAHTFSMAERVEGGGYVYAIDIQKDLLRRIANEANRYGFKNIEVIWADLEMPRGSKIADAMLDLVLLSNILFQVADKLTLLHEARRVVKGRGRIAVIDWEDSFGGLGPIPDHVVEKEMVLDLARRAGFRLEKEFPAGAHHYGLIFRPESMAQ